MTSSSLPLSADRALLDPTEDRLGYAPFAKQLARSLLRGCPADGLVVALYGAWGTGKSTALNFILHYAEQDPDADSPVIVRFNPWWFAGHEDLVRRFFSQFEAALFKWKARKRGLLKKLTAFSSVVSEVPATSAIPHAAAASAAGKLAKAALAAISTADVVKLKTELMEALAKDATRIIVVIDDIDRLAVEEIRQLFQVVKAVADFPNVIYVLAFDRDVVVKALQRFDGVDGDEYLEKIVQVPFTLPQPDRQQLQSLLFERLNHLLEGTPDELVDQKHWGNVFADGIDPFIRKPRDVVRLVNALSVTYGAVRGEVNAVDFIAVEALRIFCPAAYEIVRTNLDMFVGTSEGYGIRGERDDQRRFHESWLGQLGRDRETVKNLLGRLFPRLASVWGNTTYGDSWATEWRRTLRVCSRDVATIYFRLTVPEGDVSSALFRTILLEAVDQKAFTARLRSLAADRRPDGHTRASSLLGRLKDAAEKDVPDDAVVPIVLALFDVGDDLVRAGKSTTTAFDLGDDFRIGWVVQRLLKRLPVQDRAAVIQRAFQQCTGLVTAIRELVFFGAQHGKWNRQGVEESERLLPVEALPALEGIVLERVRAFARDGSLWAARAPSALLDAWKIFGDANEMRTAVAAHVAIDDDALIRFLSGFAGYLHSHALGDRVASVSLRLDPDRVAEFIDLTLVSPRVERLLKKKTLSKDSAAILSAFQDGVRTRKAGKDPRWAEPDDDT